MKNAARLIALDAKALARGLRPMLALADARAMYPGLAIHPDDPAADDATRDTLVDWCRRFTPLAAPDGRDGIMLDVSGCAHLFGGETAMMDEIRGRLAKQGFTAHSAIAGTPGAAWALARYGNGRLSIEDGLDAAKVAKLVGPMPLAALRLDERTIAQLGQAGLRRIGDLLLRPRAPIAARFGPDIHHRLDALLGRARDPISPRFETPPFIAERRFAEGLARREAIEATILALAHDLCGLLARHGEGARQLDVSLYRVDGVVKHLRAGTSRPLRDPAAMTRLFRERIEAVGEDGLDTGYGFDVIRLAALSAEPLAPDQTNFYRPDWTDPSDDTDIMDLVDRLAARFGPARVTRAAVADTHQPEHAAVTTAFSAGPRPKTLDVPPTADPDTLPNRPIRLFDRPEPIDTVAAVPDGPPLRFRWRRVLHHVAAIEGPERIGPEWWRVGRDKDDADATRDYFRAEDTDGRRFWLYREGLYHAQSEPRWFVHGLFA